MVEFDGLVTGERVTKEALAEFSKVLGRDMVTLGRQGARALAVDLGRVTIPFGLNENGGDKLRQRIANDIKQIFPSMDDGSAGAMRIYGVLERYDVKAAKAFWAAYRAGDRGEMEKVLRRRVSGLPRRVDRGAHQKARTGKNGRVGYGQRGVAVVKGSIRDNYIKKIRKRAGMAKAGWLHAGKGLGGRVRSGGGRDGGTAAVFPAWVRKAGARRKLGGAAVLAGDHVIKITLRNSVRHVGEIMTRGQVDLAERSAERRFESSLKRARKFAERRVRRRMKAA